MNQYIKNTLVILVVAATGYGFGRYVQPAKVTVKTEIITKEVEHKQNNIITDTKEIKKPDGTIEIDTTTEDKSVTNTTTNIDQKTVQSVENLKPQWKISGTAGFRVNRVGAVYGVLVERRIIGPIFVGLYGNDDKQGGLTIGLEF